MPSRRGPSRPASVTPAWYAGLMSSSADAPPVTRWLRCDVHVHTPLDPSRGFGEDVATALSKVEAGDDTRLREIAYRLFDACHAARMDLVV